MPPPRIQTNRSLYRMTTAELTILIWTPDSPSFSTCVAAPEPERDSDR